jgi:hypothetical protein
MDNAQLKELFALMRESGVTDLKMNGLEIRLAVAPKVPAGPAADVQVKDDVQEMTSLLKLSNEDILERMFPEPQALGGSDDSAAPG